MRRRWRKTRRSSTSTKRGGQMREGYTTTQRQTHEKNHQDSREIKEVSAFYCGLLSFASSFSPHLNLTLPTTVEARVPCWGQNKYCCKNCSELNMTSHNFFNVLRGNNQLYIQSTYNITLQYNVTPTNLNEQSTRTSVLVPKRAKKPGKRWKEEGKGGGY